MALSAPNSNIASVPKHSTILASENKRDSKHQNMQERSTLDCQNLVAKSEARNHHGLFGGLKIRISENEAKCFMKHSSTFAVLLCAIGAWQFNSSVIRLLQLPQRLLPFFDRNPQSLVVFCQVIFAACILLTKHQRGTLNSFFSRNAPRNANHVLSAALIIWLCTAGFEVFLMTAMSGTRGFLFSLVLFALQWGSQAMTFRTLTRQKGLSTGQQERRKTEQVGAEKVACLGNQPHQTEESASEESFGSDIAILALNICLFITSPFVLG